MKAGNKTLVDQIKIHLQAEHIRRLQIIENEDYSGVVRKTHEYLEETGVRFDQSYIDRGIHALKQYYAIALLDPANAHAVSIPVDPFWHAHILHTEQYHVFCGGVVGEYMHHQPLDRGNNAQVENVKTLYSYTLEIMQKLFGSVDSDFWPESGPDGLQICFHKGNQELYPDVQDIRLFEPDQRGRSYAFGV